MIDLITYNTEISDIFITDFTEPNLFALLKPPPVLIVVTLFALSCSLRLSYLLHIANNCFPFAVINETM